MEATDLKRPVVIVDIKQMKIFSIVQNAVDHFNLTKQERNL